MRCQSKTYKSILFLFFFKLTKNNPARMVQIIFVTKKTPAKLSTEKIGLNIRGGKNCPTKRNSVRFEDQLTVGSLAREILS